ncbi:hypothetical protein [Gulosibacter sediminis]|uniref:hypothetical protein n=1 Tax=Gulosibacter sediminis TaxID=1729695 RepID=UPI001867DBF8|nr:hypothetical protein [Gulosibacter sediminis]
MPLVIVGGVFVPIALISAFAGAALFFLIARFVLRRKVIEAVPASMASAYANAGNIGLPIALFSVSSAVPAISVLASQLLIIAPVYLTIFSFISRSAQPGDTSTGKLILKSVANPVTIGALIGAVLSLSQWQVPAVIWEPLDMLGHASVPLLLMMFGISLIGQTPFRTREILADVVLGTLVKLAVRDITFATSLLAFPAILVIGLVLAP